MTRLELLTLVVARARSNGFELRRWYTGRLGIPWINIEAALKLLDAQRRYYALLFSHEFASTFWKAGTEITFEVPAQTFQRNMPDGSTRTVQRRAFIRRSVRPDVWRYHLREMALAEDPLRYLRKYMHIEEQLDPEPTPAVRRKGRSDPSAPVKTAKKRVPRALPTETPAFLKRPYPGSAR